MNLDLEATAELPIKDMGALVGELAADRTLQVRVLTIDEPLSATDRYPVQIPADLQGLSANLQAVDDRMRRTTEQLAEAQAELAAMRAAAAARQPVAERGPVATAPAQAALEQELQRLRRQVARQQELLGSWQAERGVLQSMLDQRDHELDARRMPTAVPVLPAGEPLLQGDSRIAELEAEVGSLCGELAGAQRQVAALDSRVEDLSAALAAADGEAESRADAYQALERRAAAQEELALELGQRIRDAEAATAEATRIRGRAEEDLRAAEEQLHRVEVDLRQRETRLGDLQGTADPLRERIAKLEQWLRDRDEEVERLASEAAARAAVLGNLQQKLLRTGTEDNSVPVPVPALDEAIRVLVRLDGPTEVFSVLERRNTIGRTPDNGLQIDAGYVSRHHAVVLVSDKHTIIEDLNSTNGVLVNGRRVTRSILRDGDTVTIGKADFRYDVRSRGLEATRG